MKSHVLPAVVAVAFAMGGCQTSPPVDELPMSHLSTDLGAEGMKPPEKRHHMAWRAAETTQDPFLQAGHATASAEASRSLQAYHSRVPAPPVTVVPSTPDTNTHSAADPFARFRPATSVSYGGSY